MENVRIPLFFQTTATTRNETLMANKYAKLVETTKKWQQQADEAPMRVGTPSASDMERVQAKKECIQDVLEIINDNKSD